MDRLNLDSRRTALGKLGAVIAAIPIVALTRNAGAAKNEAMRQSLKYQDTPRDGKQCSACTHWVAGKTPADKGGCKIIPTDTEISPNGWCAAFVDAKK